MSQMIVDWNTITDFVVEVFVRYGVPAADAALAREMAGVLAARVRKEM